MALFDFTIVGGGFYGCALACSLAEQGYKVEVIEKEGDILTRASAVNQARVHMGYHYPRSFQTAFSSAKNFHKFSSDYRNAVENSFEKIYAIPRMQSKVSARQFLKFCQMLNIPAEKAKPHLSRIFNDRAIEGVFSVKECAFNVNILRNILRERMEQAGVNLRLQERFLKFEILPEHVEYTTERRDRLSAKYVLVCTYSEIYEHHYSFELPSLKHELTEVCIVDVPNQLRDIGITVMDGNFFSLMPYPALNKHSLTHVRYTPHFSWLETRNCNGRISPSEVLKSYEGRSHFSKMKADVERYMPISRDLSLSRSLFEIKTVLARNEVDDGRPILYKADCSSGGRVRVILGSKLDNIYDITNLVRKELK